MEPDIKKTRNYLIFSSCGKQIPKKYLNYFSSVPNIWPMWDRLYQDIAEQTMQSEETVKQDIDYLITNNYIKLTPTILNEEDLII